MQQKRDKGWVNTGHSIAQASAGSSAGERGREVVHRQRNPQPSPYIHEDADVSWPHHLPPKRVVRPQPFPHTAAGLTFLNTAPIVPLGFKRLMTLLLATFKESTPKHLLPLPTSLTLCPESPFALCLPWMCSVFSHLSALAHTWPSPGSLETAEESARPALRMRGRICALCDSRSAPTRDSWNPSWVCLTVTPHPSDAKREQ